MKVLLGHCFYRSSAPSGEDSVYKSEKELLEKNGIDVIAYEKFNDDVKISTILESINTALSTTWSKSSYNEVVSLIKRESPDVAHFHNTFPQLSPSVYKACHDCGVPVIQTLHNYRLVCPSGMLLRDGKSCELCLNGSVLPLNSLKFKCYRGSLSATASLALMIARNRLNGTYRNDVSFYIALTDFARVRLVQGGLPADKLIVKPNFLSVHSKVDAVKEGYVVFVGRLSEEKGIQTLIKAWSNIDGVQLKVLGDGHLREKLVKEVNENNLNVEFLGFRSQSEVLEIVSKAKLQIIPSECYEGFPMSVLEAFSCGTPVIASRLGSLQEIINDGDSGVLFESSNVTDLSTKILDLLNDDVKRSNIINSAMAIYREKYTDEINIKLLLDIYKSAIAYIDAG